ncbi:MAG: DUF4097 family beta strand repeat-containing protein [Limnochordia bacterium]
MNKNKRRTILMVLLLTQGLVLLGILLSLRSFGREQFFGTYQFQAQEERILAAKGQLEINNPLGSITIQGTSREDIFLRSHKRVFGRKEAEAAAALEQLQIVEEIIDDLLIIQVLPPQGESRDQVHLELEIPIRTNLDINSSLGQVTVAHLEGDSRIRAQLGEVEVTDMEGNLDIQGGMGIIRLRDIKGKDYLRLQANMGSIDFTGQLATENWLEANMGHISLNIPRSSAFTIGAIYPMGNLEHDFPFTGQETSHRLQGQIGQGPIQGQLEIISSMGEISIKGSD